MQGWTYNHRFQVEDTGQALDGPLGLDFLVAVPAKIDLGSMTLAICRKQSLRGRDPHEMIYAVILQNDLEFPGYTTVPANCCVCQGETLGDEALVFESLLTEDSGVSLPEVVLNQSEGLVGIRIDNRQADDVTLTAESMLGYVTPVTRQPARNQKDYEVLTGEFDCRQRQQDVQASSFSDSHHQ